MDPQNLTKESQNLSKIADEVIKKTDAIDIFSQLGKVEIIGSLRLKLMYRLDIDLLVISEEISKEKALEVTQRFLDSGLFRKVTLADYQTFPGYDMPLGFYWELVILHEEKEWKFDVWYLKPDERYAHLVLESIKKFESLLALNPEKAEVILKIKDAYFDGVKYKDNVKGFDIYTNVLEKGAKDVEAFATTLKSK